MNADWGLVVSLSPHNNAQQCVNQRYPASTSRPSSSHHRWHDSIAALSLPSACLCLSPLRTLLPFRDSQYQPPTTMSAPPVAPPLLTCRCQFAPLPLVCHFLQLRQLLYARRSAAPSEPSSVPTTDPQPPTHTPQRPRSPCAGAVCPACSCDGAARIRTRSTKSSRRCCSSMAPSCRRSRLRSERR